MAGCLGMGEHTTNAPPALALLQLVLQALMPQHG